MLIATRSVAVAGLTLAELLSRTRFFSLYRRMVRLERTGEEARRRAQTKRLAALLRHVGLSVPLWRRRFARLRIDPRRIRPTDARRILSQLPRTTKTEIRSGFPSEVTDGAHRDEWRLSPTSGTTDRITVVTDLDKRDHLRALELRVLRRAIGRDLGVPSVEIPASACSVVCGLVDRAPEELGAFVRDALRKGAFALLDPARLSDLRGRIERQVLHRRTTLPPLDPLPVSQLAGALDGYLDRIRAARPALLRGLPIFLVWLADRARARALRIPDLGAVIPYGGLMSPAMVARVEAGLRASFLDVYGTSELGTIGVACRSAPGVHVFEDLFLVEVVRGDIPASPGELGRVLVTDLANRAMPLVRYDVGDVGRLHTGPCACGRPGARLEIEGRVEELVARPRGEPLTASTLCDLMFARPEVANFRLEEVAPGCHVMTVVPALGAPAPDLSAIERQVGAALGPEARVRARAVSLLRPEPSGKYRVVLPLRPGATEI